MGNTWQVIEQDPERVAHVARSFNVNPLLARCILNREVLDEQEIKTFLQQNSYQPPDPFLMPDMDSAVERIARALDSGERICIYGDYDADGVTAIAILTNALRELNGDVFYYIPDRFFEGVGLNSVRLRHLKDEGVSLVISVDTGVRAFEEAEIAQTIGLDVIITDHHTPDGTRPNAVAVLNPKMEGSRYPFKGLCGAGVALKLAQALAMRFPGRVTVEKYIKIAAIGTIADMVPLREENRWIVVEGLKEICREEQGPIRALLRKIGLRGAIHALDISFKVAPRINAPGRLGDPDIAIAFFNCTTAKETNRIIEIMEGMNQVRQMIERDLESKIDLQLKHAIRDRVPPFVLVGGHFWHRGILGIMACKIMRRYNRPACVLSYDGDEAHGSIRSLPGVNLLECLNQIAPLLSSYGGHPEAAGVSLSITNVSQFKERMAELLAPKLRNSENEPLHKIDAEMNWQDLDETVFDDLRLLGPFGIGNAMPVFFSANLILESELQRKGYWYHVEVSDGFVSRKCSFYHPKRMEVRFERFDSVDLIYSLAPFRDDYQVQIIEMRPSKG